MAEVKFSEFTEVETVQDGDYFVGYRSSVNIRALKQNIATAVLGSFPQMNVLKSTNKSANFTALLAANTKVLAVDFKIVSGTPTIKVGTSNGGEEIIYQETISANAMRAVSEYFSVETTLYISVSGGVVDVNILTINNYF